MEVTLERQTRRTWRVAGPTPMTVTEARPGVFILSMPGQQMELDTKSLERASVLLQGVLEDLR